jgi:DNA-binding transcriptional regulator YdaS (Cro superfamily)
VTAANDSNAADVVAYARAYYGNDPQWVHGERDAAAEVVLYAERVAEARCARLREDLQREIERSSAEIKRLKIGALNDASELAELRSMTTKLREQLQALGVVPL